MGWTTPRTWVAGETVTATLMNEQIRDNLAVLGPLADAWDAYTPTLTNWTLGNGTLTGRYVQVGKVILYSIGLTLGSTSTMSGSLVVTLPVNINGALPTSVFPLGQAGLYDSSASARAFRFARYAGGGNTIDLEAADGTVVTGTAPWIWAAGDVIVARGTYEPA